MTDASLVTGLSETSAVDRRAFLSMAAMAAGGCAVSYAVLSQAAPTETPPPTSALPATARGPVGTVFLDMPYVDMTGMAEPYIPPAVVSTGGGRASLAADYQWAFHAIA